MMTTNYAQEIIAVKEWISKETYLPQDFEDIIVSKFVHSCYGSLEKTKKCIERFCTARATMPEVYTARDPLSSRVQKVFDITCIATYEAKEDEIIIHQLDLPSHKFEGFDFYDVLKAFTLQADGWMKISEIYPQNGHIIILDIKDYALKLIPYVNIFFFREFLVFLLEGMPVRVKQVHLINSPSYYLKLFALVKSALPQEICDIIKFHSTHEALYEYMDKKHLPSEYGGVAESMKEQHKQWIHKIQDNQKFFLNDDLWKADMKKKPKTNGVDNVMNGSFKTLSID